MNKHNNFKSLWMLAGILILLLGASLFLGRYPKPGFSFSILNSRDDLGLAILLKIRLPRVLFSMLLGMSLGAAGAVFQMLFRNPLVEPGFLGVSSGAGFGAALSILLFNGSLWILQGAALVFGIGGLVLSYIVAKKLPFGGWILRMVISGLAVSALFSAGLGIIKYTADPGSELQEMTFWMLGSLKGAVWKKTAAAAPLAIGGLAVMVLARWRMNLLSLDDLTAFSLGARPGKERFLLLAAASASVAAVTSIAGLVGWVGLLIPHMARRIYGAEGSKVVPASLLLGGIMTLVCDTLSRTLFVSEIPLGILTSLFGASLFLLLLIRGQVRIHR